MRPTFFLVGAPKSGTTSLFAYLGAHPEVVTSRIKEPCYFAPEVPVDAPTAPHRHDWQSYCALFPARRGASAAGEGSVAYFASTLAAPAIAAAVPDARILVMLRDPADRLFAHYSAARLAGATSQTFAGWISTEASRESGRTPVWGPVWAGRYATHLTRWRAHVAAERLLVLFYDDFVSDPAAVLRQAFTFLGVDAAAPIDISRRHNVSAVSRWPWLTNRLPKRVDAAVRRWMSREERLTPSPDDRAHGIALYRQEIASLQVLTGRILDSWTR